MSIPTPIPLSDVSPTFSFSFSFHPNPTPEPHRSGSERESGCTNGWTNQERAPSSSFRGMGKETHGGRRDGWVTTSALCPLPSHLHLCTSAREGWMIVAFPFVSFRFVSFPPSRHKVTTFHDAETHANDRDRERERERRTWKHESRRKERRSNNWWMDGNTKIQDASPWKTWHEKQSCIIERAWCGCEQVHSKCCREEWNNGCNVET